MTVFKSQVHEEVWIDRWCHTCFERHEAVRRLQGKDTQCPILARYFKRKRKPQEWDRTRNTDMEKSVKCNEYAPRPPSVTLVHKDYEDVPLFDVKPVDYQLIPVEGLPDKPRATGKDTNHA